MRLKLNKLGKLTKIINKSYSKIQQQSKKINNSIFKKYKEFHYPIISSRSHIIMVINMKVNLKIK